MYLYQIHSPTKQPIVPKTLSQRLNIPPPKSKLPIQKNIEDTIVIIVHIMNFEPIILFYIQSLSITNLTIIKKH